MSGEKKYLGIDWGEAKIGLAVGIGSVKIATPLKVVHSFEEMLQMIKEEGIDELVVGQPMSINHASSDMGALSHNFKDFFWKLKQTVDLPINMVDERLTTKEADKMVMNGSRKEDQDALAAMLILQAYFDKIS